jgi:hypothetical protein
MIQRKKKKDNPSEFASESMFKTCIDVLASTHGARYRSGGWYAPPGADLSAFVERGWL